MIICDEPIVFKRVHGYSVVTTCDGDIPLTVTRTVTKFCLHGGVYTRVHKADKKEVSPFYLTNR